MSSKEEFIQRLLLDLPEVLPDTPADSTQTFVRAGAWSFCVEEEEAAGDPWADAQAFIAFAIYMDQRSEDEK